MSRGTSNWSRCEASMPGLERHDFSSNRHPAPSSCLSMISAQTLRVCREGKPVPTFPDHALILVAIEFEDLRAVPLREQACICIEIKLGAGIGDVEIAHCQLADT